MLAVANTFIDLRNEDIKHVRDHVLEKVRPQREAVQRSKKRRKKNTDLRAAIVGFLVSLPDAQVMVEWDTLLLQGVWW